MLFPWGLGLLCKVSVHFYSFSLMLFLVWCLSIVIDGHASSDWSLGPMLVKVCCVSCLGLIWVFLHGVVLCRFITLCVCGTQCMHRVGVIFSVFSFFLLCDDGKKDCHSYFITTTITLVVACSSLSHAILIALVL